jgi:hypothetical protein
MVKIFKTELANREAPTSPMRREIAHAHGKVTEEYLIEA